MVLCWGLNNASWKFTNKAGWILYTTDSLWEMFSLKFPSPFRMFVLDNSGTIPSMTAEIKMEILAILFKLNFQWSSYFYLTHCQTNEETFTLINKYEEFPFLFKYLMIIISPLLICFKSKVETWIFYW